MVYLIEKGGVIKRINEIIKLLYQINFLIELN